MYTASMILGTDARLFGPPIGTIRLTAVAGEHGPAVGQLQFFDGIDGLSMERTCTCRSAGRLLDLVWAVLETFFATGELSTDVPVYAPGTEFQQRVWRELRTIRPGTTATYGQIACRVGSPHAARAVGAACGANPVPILVPCHRVIDSRGSLHGYSGGLERKEALLALEGLSAHRLLLFDQAAEAGQQSTHEL